MKYHDDRFNVGTGFANIGVRSEGWTEGTMFTPFGIVTVYAQGDDEHFHTSSLRYAINGNLFTRNYRKRFTPLGLARLANQFAREIHERETRL